MSTSSRRRARSPSMTGTTRARSSSPLTVLAPGRVDSPPTSIQSAPSPAMRTPASIASRGDANRAPSENESGVQLSTPTIRQRADTATRGLPDLGFFGIRQRPRRREDAGPRGLVGGRGLGGGRARRRRRQRRLPLEALAREDHVDLGAVDGLVLEQGLGERLELVEVVDDDLARAIVVL